MVVVICLHPKLGGVGHPERPKLSLRAANDQLQLGHVCEGDGEENQLPHWPHCQSFAARRARRRIARRAALTAFRP
jgi:hypothetical protein